MVRASLCVALLIACVVPVSAATRPESPAKLARSIAKRAAKAEKNGDAAQAYILYSEASAAQPRNRNYRAHMELLQGAAGRQSKPVVASTADAAPEHPILTPEQVFDSLTEREMANARELEGIPRLNAKAGAQDFDLSGDARELFAKVGAAFGLDPVFDGEYPPAGARIAFRVTSADYREALNDLQAATGSFVIPLSSRVFMVAKDTLSKRNDLEQTMAVTIPVPQVTTTQELTEIAQAVRQVTGVEKIGWDTAQSRIVVRDRVSRVIPAMQILRQLLSYRAEVMIDLQFIQVAFSDILNYGFTVSNTFTGIYLGHILRNAISIPNSITQLATFGGGKTLIGLGLAQAQAMFNQTTNTASLLYEAQVRSLTGQPATLHVGEKYPVITGGYIGTGITGYPPVFTYEDLGLEMKVTPFVHGDNEVSLSIETSFEVLTGQSINDIPVIGRRSIVSQARLRAGEWAVIGGLMSQTRSKGASGFQGLAQIPWLGNLFKQTSIDNEDSTVLVAIRPHLLSLPPDQVLTRALRTGTDAHPYVPL